MQGFWYRLFEYEFSRFTTTNNNNNNTYLYRIRLFSTSKILLSIRVLFKETFDKVKDLKAEILYDYNAKLRLSILRLKFTKKDSF